MGYQEEHEDAVQRSDAQVEDGKPTLGEQVGSGGEVASPSGGDQAVGGEAGEATGTPAAQPPQGNEALTMLVAGGTIGQLTNGKSLPVGPFSLYKDAQDDILANITDYNMLRTGLKLNPIALVYEGGRTECGKHIDCGWWLREVVSAEEGEAD